MTSNVSEIMIPKSVDDAADFNEKDIQEKNATTLCYIGTPKPMGNNFAKGRHWKFPLVPRGKSQILPQTISQRKSMDASTAYLKKHSINIPDTLSTTREAKKEEEKKDNDEDEDFQTASGEPAPIKVKEIKEDFHLLPTFGMGGANNSAEKLSQFIPQAFAKKL